MMGDNRITVMTASFGFVPDNRNVVGEGVRYMDALGKPSVLFPEWVQLIRRIHKY